MKVKLTICYDGTNYCGWQRQKNGVSIQQVIENALTTLLKEQIKIVGSGRTDSGVHALGQVAHFTTQNQSIPPHKIAKAVNPLLPNDIKVLESSEVDKDFNACKSAKQKTYRYNFYVSDTEIPLKERYSVKIPQIDFSSVQGGAKLFVGEHDFKNYCASGSSAKTTKRTIYEISVEKSGSDYSLTVTGNGFLYNMVRIIAGTLIELGQGKLTLQEVKSSLSGQKAKKGKTLAPKGLTLIKVEY